MGEERMRRGLGVLHLHLSDPEDGFAFRVRVLVRREDDAREVVGSPPSALQQSFPHLRLQRREPEVTSQLVWLVKVEHLRWGERPKEEDSGDDTSERCCVRWGTRCCWGLPRKHALM